ncbi:sulfur oxidation c-type cytochrome SoxA [Thioalkalivibrio denitrificans]|uniref:L-cysteine S-thiosulfotransferase subunit SoxA n=1 Tax=Thioalkalivibrio denitrificans TaxID=108003 RepID=A0A1V3N809_9GAMM|nr:sulfur oxidation c-type cytochrome SoxA [Thioalkalivibrio denitrificans]OOG21227.1 sulfur oxidation c-type cytochrome SoxA [Thioalkalivibrio denitrificans]
MTRFLSKSLAFLLLCIPFPGVSAETPVVDDRADSIAEYRRMLREGNPGELWVARGEALFHLPRGPNEVSLDECDLGLGPGVLDGAFAALPRYFEDAGRVQDLESRLVHCMVTLQGFDREQLLDEAFSSGGRESDMEALAVYVASRSNGYPLSVELSHPRELEMFRIGEALFHRRSGPMDMSCAVCHTHEQRRIRLQGLMNVNNPLQVRDVMGSWPTYRVSQGTVRTLQHRMWDCHWEMRLPDVEYGSDATVALILYLNERARGGLVDVPGIRR